MPMYDRRCESCGSIIIDCYESVTSPIVSCKECGEPTKRVLLGRSSNVIQDSIEGGVWIYHGLCNPDGSPHKYYSKSEMKKEADKRGLVNHTDLPDRHIKNRVYFT